MNFEIKDIDIEFEDCVNVIRNSFITVAEEFNITRKSAPTNPAFINSEAMAKMKEKGVRMYGGYSEGKLIESEESSALFFFSIRDLPKDISPPVIPVVNRLKNQYIK